MTVSEVKKSEETKVYKEEGQIPVRRKGPQHVAYKHYTKQESLELVDGKLKQLIELIVNPTAENAEMYPVASKVLIKIFMDQYVSGDQSNVDLIMSVFMEMLEGPVPIQKQAFDLLFNLAMHANLYEEPPQAAATSQDEAERGLSSLPPHQHSFLISPHPNPINRSQSLIYDRANS